MGEQMISRETWGQFQAAGLLWWVNRALHLFGWAIVVEVNDEGLVTEAYPARCKFRGFDEASEADGFRKLTAHLASNVSDLQKEVER